MLRRSEKLLLAIEAVLDVALHGGGTPVSSRAVAERQQTARRYLEPAFQGLVKAGILAGVRGSDGGYVLARERRRITLADIALAVGAGRLDEGIEPSSSPLGQKVVTPLAAELAEGWENLLRAVTLEDLYQRARAVQKPAAKSRGGDDSQPPGNADFVI
jgi:Rrf2 family iron-sulfur cluster assembly transcriptional regulator